MIFKTFDSTDIVAGRTQPVSTGIWSDGETSWTSFFTSSRQAQTSASALEPLNGLYYLSVYDANPTGSSSDVYFAVTYGHYAGSGSTAYDQNASQGSLLFPTKAIYNQYKNLLLTPSDQKFSFASSSAAGQISVDSDDIYVINFKTTKYKDRLDPGQFEITLASGSSNVTLIDDSRVNTNTATETGGKRFNLIRGTLDSGPVNQTLIYENIGSVYPDLGIVVLNPTALAQFVNVGLKDFTYQANGLGQMTSLLFKTIKEGAAFGPNTGMKARVTEYVPARHYFVRVKNQESNYSNNPTYVITANDKPSNSQDIGKLRFSDFSTDPKVYITTVGLYDESNELVAVAKLSQPILKDFSNECLIRIRLDM